MNRTKTVLLGASGLVAGAIVAGGVNLATAATEDGQDGATTGRTMPGYGWARGQGPARHDHTPVTGAERTDVVDAVRAEHSDVTVVAVLQDEDGSYDVMGTQDGAPVRIEVSKDLKTVELGPAVPRMGPGRGGPGGHDHTPVTGAERTDVVDAVRAEHSDVTVVAVLQDEDGSYDVMGTQGGAPVRIEVSKDLKTVELRPRHGSWHGSWWQARLR